jgi:hypothetical protein
MRVLAIRPGREAEDIQSGRAILQDSLAHPSKTVMIIRRSGPEITRFADKAGARGDPFPWREVVWITDQQLFPPGQEAEWFDLHETACAVILDIRDRPAAWLEPAARLFEIEDAFLVAESRAA